MERLKQGAAAVVVEQEAVALVGCQERVQTVFT